MNFIKGDSIIDYINKLFCMDNLELMKQLPKGKIDLIYIDPPFGIKIDEKFGMIPWNKNYQDKNEVDIIFPTLEKILTNGECNYLRWLYPRLALMKELLSEKGSIYVHLDWHIGHYVKILLDDVFGKDNFVNEIIWQKIRTTKAQSLGFGNVHDSIYNYKKGLSNIFINQYTEFDPNYIQSHYKKDENGNLFRTVSMLQKGQGNAKYFGDKLLEPPTGMHWIWSQERINESLSRGLIRFTSSGRPEKIQYLSDMKGDIIDDIWSDIYPINSQANESLDYATQKPEALLERIIKASSNEGDLVADFFCGSGTTCVVAKKLNRCYIGCDINSKAIQITEKRLNNKRSSNNECKY